MNNSDEQQKEELLATGHKLVGATWLCGCHFEYWTHESNVEASRRMIEKTLCNNHAFTTPIQNGHEAKLVSVLKKQENLVTSDDVEQLRRGTKKPKKHN